MIPALALAWLWTCCSDTSKDAVVVYAHEKPKGLFSIYIVHSWWGWVNVTCDGQPCFCNTNYTLYHFLTLRCLTYMPHSMTFLAMGRDPSANPYQISSLFHPPSGTREYSRSSIKCFFRVSLWAAEHWGNEHYHWQYSNLRICRQPCTPGVAGGIAQTGHTESLVTLAKLLWLTWRKLRILCDAITQAGV